MQVFFPAETSEQPLPRWFFDRSPSEVKAAFLTRRKKTELDQVCIPPLCEQMHSDSNCSWEARNIVQE